MDDTLKWQEPSIDYHVYRDFVNLDINYKFIYLIAIANAIYCLLFVLSGKAALNLLSGITSGLVVFIIINRQVFCSSGRMTRCVVLTHESIELLGCDVRNVKWQQVKEYSIAPFPFNNNYYALSFVYKKKKEIVVIPHNISPQQITDIIPEYVKYIGTRNFKSSLNDFKRYILFLPCVISIYVLVKLFWKATVSSVVLADSLVVGFVFVLLICLALFLNKQKQLEKENIFLYYALFLVLSGGQVLVSLTNLMQVYD